MKILVISLEEATDRRKFQKKYLLDLGLEFEIIRATSPDTLSQDNYLHIDWLRWERCMRDTEKACFISHLRCWSLIAGATEPMLIIEDDAILSVNAPAALRAIENMKGIDRVNLETTGKKKYINNMQVLCGSLSFCELLWDRSGAGAYILWPDAAKKLINLAEMRGAALVDAFLNSAGRSMNCAQVWPAIAIQPCMSPLYSYKPPIGIDSFILLAEPNSAKKNCRKLDTFIWRRILGQLRLVWIKFQLIGRSRKVLVPLDIEGMP